MAAAADFDAGKANFLKNRTRAKQGYLDITLTTTNTISGSAGTSEVVKIPVEKFNDYGLFMAHKLVTGWNDSGLCLNYAGDKIVTMESPAPYANRELKKLF